MIITNMSNYQEETEQEICVNGKNFVSYITHDRILEQTKNLGTRINKDYYGKHLYIIGVLTGSYMFMSDLTKEVTLPAYITTMKVSSYEGTTSSDISLDIGIKDDIKGKDILIVEDIVDSGKTMEFVLEYIKNKEPNSVQIVSLFVKPEANIRNIIVKYTGFEIPTKFIVGYGLDFDGYGRNLKNIYQLKE